MSGPAIPDVRDAVTGDYADQASAAVLKVNLDGSGRIVGAPGCQLDCGRIAGFNLAAIGA
jgi:hypothetical protein